MLLESCLQGLSVSFLGTREGLMCTSETFLCFSLLSAPSLAAATGSITTAYVIHIWGLWFPARVLLWSLCGNEDNCPASRHQTGWMWALQFPCVSVQWKVSFYVGELPLSRNLVQEPWDPALEDRWDLMELAELSSVSAPDSPGICLQSCLCLVTLFSLQAMIHLHLECWSLLQFVWAWLSGFKGLMRYIKSQQTLTSHLFL